MTDPRSPSSPYDEGPDYRPRSARQSQGRAINQQIREMLAEKRRRASRSSPLAAGFTDRMEGRTQRVELPDPCAPSEEDLRKAEEHRAGGHQWFRAGAGYHDMNDDQGGGGSGDAA